MGSFEHDGVAINLCFTGSRVTKGGQICNQSISLSFDPSNLTCISCEKEHSIITSLGPVCVCVSDQNFAPNLSRVEKCISVIRLESGGLSELTELVQEIFGSNKFLPGSVICVWSASHLHSVGPTIYAQDCIRTVSEMTKKIDGIQVCPLIPILQQTILGSLASDLVKIAIWHSNVYKGTMLGLIDTWVKLAQQLTVQTVTDISEPTYTSVALPDSTKSSAQLVAHRFVSTSSCRVNSMGFDAKTTNELLNTLLTTLHRDFGICCNPGLKPVREPLITQGVSEKTGHIILVGASHMRRTAAHRKDLGLSVTECQLPGGVPKENSIECVQNFLTEKASEQDTAVVFDLFGNFTFRFEQEDGNMALLIRLGGKHHRLGKVGVCGEKSFKQLIAKLLPLLNTNPHQPKIVMPPIPRYISGGCCKDHTHARNATEENHAVTMIGHVAGL